MVYCSVRRNVLSEGGRYVQPKRSIPCVELCEPDQAQEAKGEAMMPSLELCKCGTLLAMVGVRTEPLGVLTLKCPACGYLVSGKSEAETGSRWNARNRPKKRKASDEGKTQEGSGIRTILAVLDRG